MIVHQPIDTEPEHELTQIAQRVIDCGWQIALKKEIMRLEREIATVMVVKGCKQKDLREKFGNTKGQILWQENKGIVPHYKRRRAKNAEAEN